MLEINDIHTWYGDSYVLQGVNMEVGEAKVIVLLGRNGMGKTTTIRSIMGLTHDLPLPVRHRKPHDGGAHQRQA